MARRHSGQWLGVGVVRSLLLEPFWSEAGYPPGEADGSPNAHHFAHHSGVTGWMSGLDIAW